VGDPAPSLVATAANGQKIDLAALKGKHVVVYFYPKDDTPGCTKEACAFRDAWATLEKASIVVIGVSHDDDASHQAFAEKHKLPFALIADTDSSIAKRYGVPELKPGIYARVSYLIGPDGRVKKVYPKVDPGLHADEILEDASH
jgi:peroxiredoxin Q/BCP